MFVLISFAVSFPTSFVPEWITMYTTGKGGREFFFGGGGVLKFFEGNRGMVKFLKAGRGGCQFF